MPTIPWRVGFRVLVLLVIIGTVGLFWIEGTYRTLDLDAIRTRIGQTGLWAPLAFIGLYVFWPLLFLPAAAMTLIGGALFGPVLGAMYSMTGALLGACNAFLVARYVAGNWVYRRYPGRLDLVRQGVVAQGLMFVIWARMLPLFPYSFLNYALGLTPLKIRQFILGSLIGMSPTIVAYSYLGWAGGELLAQREQWLFRLLTVLAVLLVLVWLPAFYWHRRRIQRNG